MIRPSTFIRYGPDRTLGDGGWQQHAACRDTDPELWFVPGQGDAWEHHSHAAQLAEAKAVCASCPVAAECLAGAYEQPIDRDGVRGGLTPRERERLKQRARRQKKAIA